MINATIAKLAGQALLGRRRFYLLLAFPLLLIALVALVTALTDGEAAGLPAINVSPPHGKMLHLLARATGARKILEIGTLAGYSTIWMARALPPGGRLVTLEIDPRHAEVARANFARAGLSSVIELRLGRALDSLPRLREAGEGLGFRRREGARRVLDARPLGLEPHALSEGPRGRRPDRQQQQQRRRARRPPQR